jgi:hypothetical protein
MDNNLLLFSAIGGIVIIMLIARNVTSKSQALSINNSNKEVINEINKIRVNGNLRPLIECKNLNDCASDFALDQYQRQFFTHTNPEGVSPLNRVKSAGYNVVNSSTFKVSQMLAVDLPTATAVVSAWVQIPSNLSVISDPLAEHIGSGAVEGVIEAWRTQGYDNWNRVPFWCVLICSGGVCSQASAPLNQSLFAGVPSCTKNDCFMLGRMQANAPQAYVGTT